MKPLYKYLIVAAITVLVLFMTFFWGCQYGKTCVKCPVITHDTIIHYDTIFHHIKDTVPEYVQILDTVFIPHNIPQVIDTAKILDAYYSTYAYSRQWENDTILVKLHDVITQNKFVNNNFNYKIKIPFQTIVNNVDNSIHYTKYVYLGASIPFKNNQVSSLHVLYAFRKAYVGIQYSPLVNSWGVSGGLVLFHFK